MSQGQVPPFVGLAVLLLTLILTVAGSQVSLALAEQVQAQTVGTTNFWSPPVHITKNFPDGASMPHIEISMGGELTIVYNQENSDVINPHFARSSDGGRFWTSPAPMRSSAQQLLQATFVYHNNTAHAVWRTDGGVYHALEDQWPSEENTIISETDRVFQPDVASANDGRVHVVWAEGENLQNIYHAYTTNNGAAWTISPALATFDDLSQAPAIAVDASGNIHVVWEELLLVGVPPTIRNEVHYRKGTKSGTSYDWGDITVLSSSFSNARRPVITTNSDTVHVGFSVDVQVGLDTAQAPYYQSYSDGAWSNPIEVSNGNPVYVNTASPFFLVPTLAACDGAVFYFYHGSETTNGKERILGVRRPNFNSQWNSVEIVTDAVTRAVNPSIACEGSRLHLAFEEILIDDSAHRIHYTSSRFRVNLPMVTK